MLAPQLPVFVAQDDRLDGSHFFEREVALVHDEAIVGADRIRIGRNDRAQRLEVGAYAFCREGGYDRRLERLAVDWTRHLQFLNKQRARAFADKKRRGDE